MNLEERYKKVCELTDSGVPLHAGVDPHNPWKLQEVSVGIKPGKMSESHEAYIFSIVEQSLLRSKYAVGISMFAFILSLICIYQTFKM